MHRYLAKSIEIARAMGVEGVDDMTQEEYRKAAIDAVKKLSADVGIPADLKDIVKRKIFHSWHSQHMMMHADRVTQERTSVEEITKLYESLCKRWMLCYNRIWNSNRACICTPYFYKVFIG